jgi:hypothetical protein
MLDDIRAYLKQQWSVCYRCKSASIGIVAEGYLLYPACKVHEAIADTIRENSEILERLGSDYDADGKPYWLT